MGKDGSTAAIQVRNWRPAFMRAYRRTGNMTTAAKAAGIARTSAYRYMQNHPEFAAKVKAAQDEAVEHLEQEAYRRSMEGWDEPVFYKDQVVGFKRRFSDTLLIFLLKGLAPDKYKDAVTKSTVVNIEGKDDTRILVLNNDEALEAAAALASAGALPAPVEDADG